MLPISGFLNLWTIDSLGSMTLCGGTTLCIVRCLEAALASIWLETITSLPHPLSSIITTKNLWTIILLEDHLEDWPQAFLCIHQCICNVTSYLLSSGFYFSTPLIWPGFVTDFSLCSELVVMGLSSKPRSCEAIHSSTWFFCTPGSQLNKPKLGA